MLVGALAFGVGAWVSMERFGVSPAADGQGAIGYVLDTPRPLPEFALTDQDGEPFGTAGFHGDWSLIYFGFTFCPDICPTSLAEMARVHEQLERARPTLRDRYYLVSVDPRRDSPARLRDYVRYFHPEFRGLTGAKEQIDLLVRAAGAVYSVPDAPPDEDYLVAHSSTITLVDPQGRIHAIFTTPLQAGPIADRILEIVDRWPAEVAKSALSAMGEGTEGKT